MKSDNDDIRKYHEGTLTREERHALEKRALDDPFLADALEGAESVTPAEFRADLDDISRRVQGPARPWLSPVRIAAGIAVLLGAAALFIFLPEGEPTGLLASKEQTAPGSGDSLLAANKDSVQQLITMAEAEKDQKQPVADSENQAADKPQVLALRRDQRDKGKAATKPAETSTASGGTVSSELAAAEEPKNEAKVTEDAGPTEAEKKADTRDEAARVEPSAAVAQQEIGEAKKKSADAAGARALRSKESFAYAPGRSVSGTVTTPDGGALPGANIVLKGMSNGTVTDIKGHYSMNVPENSTLVVSFIGMATQEVVTGERNIVDIQMAEDAAQLSEVVVTGYKRSDDDDKEPLIKLASPAGGLRAYNRYLEKNMRYPREALDNKVKGKVTVQFTVGTTGVLSDFSVLRSLGHGCDEEVIRLVKEGPKWSPSTSDDAPIESEVRVKVKFDPEKAGQ